MNPFRKFIIRRRLAATMKPDPAYRQRRLAQLSPARRERYLATIASIEAQQ